MATITWKTTEELLLEQKQQPSELEQLKKNQELMQKALDEILLSGGGL